MVLSYLIVTLLSVAVTAAGIIIDFGVMCTSWTVYGLSQSLIIDTSRHEMPWYAVLGAYLAFASSCGFFAVLASAMCVFVSPQAEGSGIPDVKSYLNGVHLKGLFSVPTCIAKAMGCAFSIGSGLIAGREGPIIHVGAILGSAVSQGSSRAFKTRLPSALVRHFRSAEWKRDFAVMGSAFGVATAFTAPMGGVLFAIEEGATVWRQQLTFLSLYGACATTFLTSLVKGYLHTPKHSPVMPAVLFGTFRHESPDILFRARDFPYVLLVGLIGGIVGALFSYLQTHTMAFRRKYIRISKFRTVLEVLAVSLIISSCRFWVPYLFGKCIDDHDFEIAQGESHEYHGVPHATPFHCHHHHANDMGLLFWVPQESMLRWVLHSEGYDHISTAQLWYALIFYFFGTVLVFGIAVPSGLFIPSFVIGALYGRLVGQLHAYMTGNYQLITSFTFLGSASCLGGMTRVTISVALIALESTQNVTASLYCFMVVIIAKLVADSVNIGIYDLVIVMKEIPFLVDDLGYEGYQLTVDEVMTPLKTVHESGGPGSRGVVVSPMEEDSEEAEFSPQGIAKKRNSAVAEQAMMASMARTADSAIPFDDADRAAIEPDFDGIAEIVSTGTLEAVLNVLFTYQKDHEFLVINEIGGLEGTVERLIILRILEKRLFGLNAPLLHYSSVDSAWPNLRNTLAEEGERQLRRDIEAQHDTKSIIIDLRPYVEREPAIVLSSSSMQKAHSHIRNGERTVLVASPASVNIVGIVKRHHLMPGFLEATLHAKKRQQARERAASAAQYATTQEQPEGSPQGAQMGAVVDPESGAMVSRQQSEEEYYFSEDFNFEGGDEHDVGRENSHDISLNQFEPRFYNLLMHYLTHPEERRRVRRRNGPQRYAIAAKTTKKELNSM
jgi:H+/Cl- antiporter ClcA